MPTFINVITKEIRDSVPESELSDDPDWANVGTRENLPQSPKYGWRFDKDSSGQWTVRGPTEAEEAEDQAKLLALAITSKIEEIKDRVEAEANRRYPARTRELIRDHLVAAQLQGLTNRAAYYAQFIFWEQALTPLLGACFESIYGMNSAGAVANIDLTWMEQFFATDPGTDLFVGEAIKD